ncbi:hypothetical protein ECMP02155212_5241 [Escherichia coli MP021552.12]|nr:hypothetical protein ECMP02155212_5241 [Escherichia coli MP021552.12]
MRVLARRSQHKISRFQRQSFIQSCSGIPERLKVHTDAQIINVGEKQ